MIKVIEHGYRYHMETTCPNCSCRFSYEWEDVETCYNKMPSYYIYTTTPTYWITCPECMHRFEILNWSFTYPSKKTNITWTCNPYTYSYTENEEDCGECSECKCKKED